MDQPESATGTPDIGPTRYTGDHVPTNTKSRARRSNGQWQLSDSMPTGDSNFMVNPEATLQMRKAVELDSIDPYHWDASFYLSGMAHTFRTFTNRTYITTAQNCATNNTW